MKKITSKDSNFFSSEYYSPSYLLSHFPKYKIFCTFGSRGRGKTYSGKNLILNRFNDGRYGKGKKKFAWIRLNEDAIVNLLENDGATFFEQSLLNKHKVSVTTKGSNIYFNEEEVGKALSLQKYGSWKGNQFEDYDLIIIDELIRSDSEKKSWSIPSAFINTLENICRERKDVMIIVYANTIDEMMEVKELFGFMPFPGQFGVFKIPQKWTIIEYLQDSSNWKARKKDTIAGRLGANKSEFSNQFVSLLSSRSALLQSYNKVKKHLQWYTGFQIAKNCMIDIYRMTNSNIIYITEQNLKIPRSRWINDYALKSVFVHPGVSYNPEAVKWLKEKVVKNQVRFPNMDIMARFYQYMQAYNILT